MFYLNIRENAKARVQVWQLRSKQITFELKAKVRDFDTGIAVVKGVNRSPKVSFVKIDKVIDRSQG